MNRKGNEADGGSRGRWRSKERKQWQEDSRWGWRVKKNQGRVRWGWWRENLQERKNECERICIKKKENNPKNGKQRRLKAKAIKSKGFFPFNPLLSYLFPP